MPGSLHARHGRAPVWTYKCQVLCSDSHAAKLKTHWRTTELLQVIQRSTQGLSAARPETPLQAMEFVALIPLFLARLLSPLSPPGTYWETRVRARPDLPARAVLPTLCT